MENTLQDTQAIESILANTYAESELVIGLVTSVGTDLSLTIQNLKQRLGHFGYQVKEVKISKDIINKCKKIEENSYFDRIKLYMNEGNRLRQKSGFNSILALGAVDFIKKNRKAHQKLKTAYIINSLKHPDEAHALRKIYSNGFFLLGIHGDKDRRKNYLMTNDQLTSNQADELISRDDSEKEKYGQQTRETFHLSDFFISVDYNTDKLQNSLWRIVDLIFGNPFITPTFDEYAMFMAFSASLRSADLSRQVGAVICRNSSIISTGANDIPKAGGGLYWPTFNENTFKFEDEPNGRDYMRGKDSNYDEKQKIISEITHDLDVDEVAKSKFIEALKSSKIKDLTEFGRVVHAEMEAILSCARNGISTQDAILYCTTFPCHNCAKHIISSGVKRVVYVEPYPKSKALEFHDESIVMGESKDDKIVVFEPFIGVGPRSFFNLFSLNLGSGSPVSRKGDHGKPMGWDSDSKTINWPNSEGGRLRMQLLPFSYIEREKMASILLKKMGNLDS